MSVDKLDKILEAIEDRGRKSDIAHKALKAEIMKAIPDDHVEAHKKIERFMGRLEPDTHLDDHEYTSPKRKRWNTIQGQLTKNAGNTIYFIIISAIVLWIASAVGALPHVP